ncbi:hypothetical protein [Ferviditalea candida]|uniref:Membrane protein YesL n=1 Tax=Ferviditalea candida TaxID=3108399 RepID=A0ABU5ZI09_9BACL|nr:hypothetical protein [Paenibacillaceae bacterium T2]
MLEYLKNGWKATRRQLPLMVILFIYRFIWAFILYNFVRTVTTPLLHRYPGALSAYSSHLFIAESQFRLAKTDLADSYLWLLALVLLVRISLTPLINAGLYYSISSGDAPKAANFLRGMRMLGKPFFYIYFAQAFLLLAPLFWLIPIGMHSIGESFGLLSLVRALLPLLAGYLLYTAVVYLLFMYIQFGKASDKKLIFSLILFARYLPSILWLAFTLFAITGLVGLITLAASFWWAGLFAVIVHLGYYFVKTLFEVWKLSSNYQLWMSKQN